MGHVCTDSPVHHLHPYPWLLLIIFSIDRLESGISAARGENGFSQAGEDPAPREVQPPPFFPPERGT